MIWTIISSSLVFLISIWLGKKRYLKLEEITMRRFLLSGILTLILFLLLRFLNNMGYFPQPLGAGFMSGLYASIAGFFTGAAYDQYQMKKDLGDIEYVNTAFISNLLPNLIALTLIVLGIARTSVLDQLPVTPIRLASGISLMSIGLYAITLRITPEFRKKGFVILDREFPWKNLIAYQWYEDQVIELEFEYEGEIRLHRSIVKPEDEKEVEKILAKKMREKVENKRNENDE